MRILALHVDYIKFKPLKKALKKINDLSEEEKRLKEVEDSLVILSAVEKGDGIEIVGELVKNIKEIAKQVKTKSIVLYPYVHLSNNPSSPETAIDVLSSVEEELKKDFKVTKAPFGYYKEFELKVKGHPLSELSREIKSKKSADEDYDPKQLLREISKTRLDSSKLKDNDHRIIGQQMDLYSFSEVAPGMVFWHNNGLVIKNELFNFARDILAKQGYKEISTPQIMDKKLWQISGHWDKYKENNFITEYEKRKFLIKPMNCPGVILVYKNKPKSYKEFPLRIGEFGIVHRQELSGVLGGLFRVVQFTQDDAHIFCTEDQIEGEISGLIDLTTFFYDKFGIKINRVELSTRPEKRIGSDEMWDKAEQILERVLKKKKIKYKINHGDGAFYGPKIDFHIEDSLKRTWQTSTIQLDFSMPERFDLVYIDKDNNRKRPIMIHRTIYGSLERFIGILIEHTKGRLPVWLAPIQVRILSFTDRNVDYAKQVIKELGEEIPDLRIDADFTQTTIPSKVKDSEIMRIPYTIVLGDKEEKDRSLAVRVKGDKKIQKFSIRDFVEKLKKEIKEKE